GGGGWARWGGARGRGRGVHGEAGGGFGLVGRHDDVATILRAPAVFSSADGITIPHNPSAPVMPPIDLDPPLQTEFRQLLNPYFTARAVRSHAPAIATLARQLIDRFATQSECELTGAFARPLPALVLGRSILGVEHLAAGRQLRPGGGAPAAKTAPGAAGGGGRSPREYVPASAPGGRPRPADGGLVSTLVHGHVAGRPVTEQEQVG